jgi:hypothetical protein
MLNGSRRVRGGLDVFGLEAEADEAAGEVLEAGDGGEEA